MFTDIKKNKQKNPFDVTIYTQVVIGILDLWNASTYRPHRSIVRKIRYLLQVSDFPTHLYLGSRSLIIGKITSLRLADNR